jgi:acetate kinase
MLVVKDRDIALGKEKKKNKEKRNYGVHGISYDDYTK